MKKATLIALLGLWILPFGLVSCIFDDQRNASSWLDAIGSPDRIGLVHVDVPGIVPSVAHVGTDSLPFGVGPVAALGEVLGSRQELFLDFLVYDTGATHYFKVTDGARADLRLTLDSVFYASFPDAHPFPLMDALDVKIAWNLEAKIDTDAVDSIYTMRDSLRLESMLSLIRGKTQWAETATSIAVDLHNGKSSLTIALPDSLQSLLRDAGSFFRLQARIVFDGASRIYRFQGPTSSQGGAPELVLHKDTAEYSGLKDTTDFRLKAFQAGFPMESCVDCMVLHGGGRESLFVEVPGDLLWKALQKAMQDSLDVDPEKLDSLLTDQLVVHALLDFSADTALANSELGYAVPLIAASLLDTVARVGIVGDFVAESYVLDTALIRESGHPNLLFREGHGTASVQVTQGVKYWLQSARLGSRLRFSLRMAPPVLKPDSLDKKQSGYSSYARWNLGSADSLKVGVRFWVTEKR